MRRSTHTKNPPSKRAFAEEESKKDSGSANSKRKFTASSNTQSTPSSPKKSKKQDTDENDPSSSNKSKTDSGNENSSASKPQKGQGKKKDPRLEARQHRCPRKTQRFPFLPTPKRPKSNLESYGQVGSTVK